MAIKIEKSVPMQHLNTILTNEIRDALSKMEIGDSFIAPGKRAQDYYRIALSMQRTHPGLRIRTSAREGKLRVWRIA